MAWTLQNQNRDVHVQSTSQNEITCLVNILQNFDLDTQRAILSVKEDDTESAAWQRRYALMQDAIAEQPAVNVGKVLNAFENATAEDRQRLWKKLATQGLSDALRIDGLLDPCADWLKSSSGPPLRQLEDAKQKVAASQDNILLAETRLQLLEAMQLAHTAESCEKSENDYNALIKTAKEKVRRMIATGTLHVNTLQKLLMQTRTARDVAAVDAPAAAQQPDSSLSKVILESDEALTKFASVMDSVEAKTVQKLDTTLKLFRIQRYNVALLEAAYNFKTDELAAHWCKAQIAQQLDEQVDREFYSQPDGLYLQTFLPAIIKTIERLGGSQASEEVRNFASKDPSLQSYADAAQELDLLPRLPCKETSIETDITHVEACRSVYAVQAQYYRSTAYLLRDSQNAVQYCVLDDLWDSAQGAEDMLLSNAEEINIQGASQEVNSAGPLSNAQGKLDTFLKTTTTPIYAVQVIGSDDDAVSKVAPASAKSWYAVGSKDKFARLWQDFTQMFLIGQQSAQKKDTCNVLFSSAWAMPSGIEVTAAAVETTDQHTRVDLLFNMLFRVVAQLAVWLDNNALNGSSFNVNDYENGMLHLDLAAEPDSDMSTSKPTAENLYAAFSDLQCFWDMNKESPEQLYALTNRMAHEHMLQKNAKDCSYTSHSPGLDHVMFTNTMHVLSLPDPTRFKDIEIDNIVQRHFTATTDFINFAHDFVVKFLEDAEAVVAKPDYFCPEGVEVPLLPEDLTNQLNELEKTEAHAPLKLLQPVTTVHAAWARKKKLLGGAEQILQSIQNAKYQTEPYRYCLSKDDTETKVLYVTQSNVFIENKFTIAIIQYHCALRQYCYLIQTIKDLASNLQVFTQSAASLKGPAKKSMVNMVTTQETLKATFMSAARSLHVFLISLQSDMIRLAKDITMAINQTKQERTDRYSLPLYVFDVKFGDGTIYFSGQVKSTMKSNVTLPEIQT